MDIQKLLSVRLYKPLDDPVARALNGNRTGGKILWEKERSISWEN